MKARASFPLSSTNPKAKVTRTETLQRPGIRKNNGRTDGYYRGHQRATRRPGIMGRGVASTSQPVATGTDATTTATTAESWHLDTAVRPYQSPEAGDSIAAAAASTKTAPRDHHRPALHQPIS
ncbi:30s ribosomal protein s8 [Lasius niger]|uniref:30s ribosomal protein s8 n=1 Tax=Lasius niger TaxID=67767 RepID=A0A0J7KTV6_LASNI|nr:30s ribosomal protein s8 [Lasius niger]